MHASGARKFDLTKGVPLIEARKTVPQTQRGA